MFALLAEAVATPEAGAPPAWVTTLLGVATVVLGALKALDAARVAQLQGALRATKEGLRVVAGVLDRLDGDEVDPQKIRDEIRDKSTKAGTEPVIKATLAEIRGVAPKPPGASPGLNGVAPALLLALCLGSGCVAGEVHETAVRAKATATTVRAKAATFRRIVVPASTEGRAVAATLALGDELEAALADLETAIGKVEEASR